jgi:hypothetical protein
MPLPRVVDGIWKVVESSRAKEEVGEVWAQQSIMREHESACKVPPPPPLPTHATLGKVSCIVLGAITPCGTCIANDK